MEIELFFKKLNSIIDEFYEEKFNLEKLEKYSYFIWKKKYFNFYLKEIKHPEIIDFDSLIGIDKIKQSLFLNTLQFLKGFKANNILLWGEKGCGKSSLIKSIIPLFRDYNLKLIQVNSSNFQSIEELFEIISQINFKFIVFLDDISFKEEDENFKILKDILDGLLIENSGNFLIYATSNRRHLIKELFNNNEKHTIDAISEKISLADRFGISWGFYKPDKETYLKIVKNYLKIFNLPELYNEKEALQFAMQKGGFSGRTAYQYSIFLHGKLLRNVRF